MSHSVEACYDFYHEVETVARRERRCDACREPIAPKHRYVRVAWKFDGTFMAIGRCLRCQALHLHLRDKGDRASAYDTTWPAERLDCGQDYEEEWGTLPPEIAALAFVTADEMQQA